MAEQWLQELKVGDLVIVSSNYGEALVVVERVTKTQIVLPSGKFSKSSGRLVCGGVWGSAYLQEATPECIKKLKEKIYRTKLIRKVSNIDCKKLINSQLERIITILDES